MSSGKLARFADGSAVVQVKSPVFFTYSSYKWLWRLVLNIFTMSYNFLELWYWKLIQTISSFRAIPDKQGVEGGCIK